MVKVPCTQCWRLDSVSGSFTWFSRWWAHRIQLPGPQSNWLLLPHTVRASSGWLLWLLLSVNQFRDRGKYWWRGGFGGIIRTWCRLLSFSFLSKSICCCITFGRLSFLPVLYGFWENRHRKWVGWSTFRWVHGKSIWRFWRSKNWRGKGVYWWYFFCRNWGDYNVKIWQERLFEWGWVCWIWEGSLWRILDFDFRTWEQRVVGSLIGK